MSINLVLLDLFLWRFSNSESMLPHLRAHVLVGAAVTPDKSVDRLKTHVNVGKVDFT